MLNEKLQKVFTRQVADRVAGITADDLNSEAVRLILAAANVDMLAEGTADIGKQERC